MLRNYLVMVLTGSRAKIGSWWDDEASGCFSTITLLLARGSYFLGNLIRSFWRGSMFGMRDDELAPADWFYLLSSIAMVTVLRPTFLRWKNRPHCSGS